MTMSEITEEGLAARFAHATRLIQEAGALAARMRQTLAPIETKSPIDFCTEADHAVEKLLRDDLVARFGDGFIGEEGGGEATSGVWVVDPIDGTTEYIHGTSRWCVSLAFVVNNRIELGLLYAPAENRLFLARRGHGATMNGEPITVSGLLHGAAPVVEFGWSERRPLSTYCEILQALYRQGIEFRRHGSGALGLADVACGRNDAYLELHINAWDALAGLLLVQEAGGWTNDFLAGDGLTRGNLVIAATPELKDRLLSILP